MNELIEKHSKKGSKMPEKEVKEKVSILKEDLKEKGVLAPPSSPGPVKRGRPRKNSNPEPMLQADPVMPKPPITEAKQEDEADKLKRRRLIKQLRFLCNRFSNIVGSDLVNFNPHTCSLEALERVIEEIKLAVSDTLEEGTLPTWIDNGLETAENAVFAAISNPKLLQKYPGLSKLFLFRGIGAAASKNPLIKADMALIASDFISLIPSSPYMRLGINLAQVAMGVVQYNAQMAGIVPNAQKVPEGFDEF